MGTGEGEGGLSGSPLEARRPVELKQSKIHLEKMV